MRNIPIYWKYYKNKCINETMKILFIFQQGFLVPFNCLGHEYFAWRFNNSFSYTFRSRFTYCYSFFSSRNLTSLLFET